MGTYRDALATGAARVMIVIMVVVMVMVMVIMMVVLVLVIVVVIVIMVTVVVWVTGSKVIRLTQRSVSGDVVDAGDGHVTGR